MGNFDTWKIVPVRQYKRPNKLKAWQVITIYEDYSIIVFAKTNGKAREIAQHSDGFENYAFIEIKAYRAPLMDGEYRGHDIMDWDDPEDRTALVKKCNFQCLDVYIEECKQCCARDFCEGYKNETNRLEKCHFDFIKEN